ncbi:MAG: long-chain fatty acid--CoA ligase [Planctomycetaceae bacterium]|nr:long-chain fatty acid--CoA ligase [Planctomycetaceae bacterium]
MVTLNGRRGPVASQTGSLTSWLESLGNLGGWYRPDGHRMLHGRPWVQHYAPGVPAHLAYPDQPLSWLLEQAAERFPTRTACHYYHEQLTYSELMEQARRLAAVFIREGLQPGDRVGVLFPNLPETLVTLFATWLAGGVVVSLSPLMVAEEVQSLLKATDCRFVVTLDVLSPLVCGGLQAPELVILSSLAGRLSRLELLGYAWMRFQRIGFGTACPRTRVLNYEDALKNAPHELQSPTVNPNSPAFVLPTGGTTGKPKAVTLSHRNLLSQAWQLSHWSRGHHGEETILAVLPFFHSYGLSTSVMMGFALGATLVLHHRFRPLSVVQLIEQHRPTMFLAVPAMLAALNNKVLREGKYDLKSLQSVISGGATLPQTVADEFNKYTGAQVVEGYGLSEASPVTHVGPVFGTVTPGTIGVPIPDTDACIVDQETGRSVLPTGEVGELLVRGPQVMLGYWNDQQATNQVIRDGWLHTGDLATCDERGFFKIVDRIKDLIITSGFNVYPGDVEEVIRTYPGVKDAAVVGEPDEDRGEIVRAVLVVNSLKEFRKADFEDFCRRKLAAHKRPRLIDARTEDLPRNFLGKVLRRELRQHAESTDHGTVRGVPN